jgi:rod shape determining protein RodA
MPRVVSWRKLRFRFDWTLSVAAAVCIALGLLNLWSAVRERQFHLFAQQLSWLAGGTLIFLAIASFDYRIISRIGYILYGFGIVLLVAVLVHGKVVSGSRRWFDLGAFHLQPSELMKVLTIIALAKYIHDTPALDGRTLRHILVPLFLAGLPVLLIAAQPDLGTALIIGLISATVVLIARLRMKTLGGIVVAGALALAPLWEYALHDYQRNRVLAFINPALDPATAWQPRQAMNAVGSGRFIGKGFLQGTQIRLRSLPALWTDFPICRVGGGMGLHRLHSRAYRLRFARALGAEDRPRGARPLRHHRVRGRRLHAVLAGRRQHRHGDRPAARRRRDLAAHQLRRFQRADGHACAWPSHERVRAKIRVLTLTTLAPSPPAILAGDNQPYQG